MPQDYSRQNLRGRSFKGQNLEGANFIGADIRGADFSYAILRGTNFSYAEAGVQKRWTTFLLITLWLLSGISGYLSAFLGLLIRFIRSSIFTFQLGGWVALIVVIVLFIIIIRRGLNSSVIAIAIAFALAFAFAGGIAFLVSAIDSDVSAEIGGIAVAFAFAGVVVIVVALAGPIALIGAFILAGPLGGVGAGIFSFVCAFIFKGLFAIAGVIVGTILSAYIAWDAIKGGEKYAFIRNIAVAYAAFNGTSFRNADLTDSNFREATLKSTDFRKAILTRTCFYKTKKLDRVRPGSTYLQDKELYRLLVTGSCSGKDFNNRNLRGLNLSGANLVNASFIGTDFYQSSLKEADLTGSLLVRTQFESTDLTGATLTGACIEDWVVTSTTKLDSIQCKYVFMKYTEGDKRDKMPLKGEFKNDDFILFVQSILDTIKLYHERDVNPKLALYVLQTLSEDYQCTLEIVKIEKRGESGAIIEVKIPGNFNQEKLKETYYEKYNQYLKFYMTDPKNELKSPTNIENVTVHKGVLIGGSVSNSTVSYTIDTEGDIIMSEGSKQQFNNDLRNAQIAGGLVNAGEVEAGQIGGNINNYTLQQRQNLTEAAAQIQQLLQQLEQSYPSNTTTGKMTIATETIKRIENDPTIKERVLSALKAGGVQALAQLLNHPAASFVIGALEDWQKTQGS